MNSISVDYPLFGRLGMQMDIKQLLPIIWTKASAKLNRSGWKRKARLYCVGTAKSGTHSIDAMFGDAVRSSHERESEEVIQKIFDISTGLAADADVFSYIEERDKRLCLDVDSSQLNFFLLDYLLQKFPDALFLLTIRDCYSWLDSFINHTLRFNAPEYWLKLRDYRFQASTLTHPPEERALKEKGLYTLDGYLSYWAKHNGKVISATPEDRLMIVKTAEITAKAYEIAAFAGLPENSVRIEKTHSFKASEQFHVLREIPEAYLEEKIRRYCAPLMARFYPEIRSINDTKA